MFYWFLLCSSWWCDMTLDHQYKSFPMVYDVSMLRWIGISYNIGNQELFKQHKNTGLHNNEHDEDEYDWILNHALKGMKCEMSSLACSMRENMQSGTVGGVERIGEYVLSSDIKSCQFYLKVAKEYLVYYVGICYVIFIPSSNLTLCTTLNFNLIKICCLHKRRSHKIKKSPLNFCSLNLCFSLLDISTRCPYMYQWIIVYMV